MPAFTLTPASAGNYTQWALGAGPSKVAAVTDASDVTYILGDQNSTLIESFVVNDLPADAGSVVAPVVWSYRQTYTGDPVTNSALFRYNSTDSYLSAAVTGPSSLSNQTVNFTDEPGGSGGWSVAGVNGVELGVRTVTGNNDFTYVYELSATGNYLLGNGGFAFLINLVGPLIGAGLMLKELPRLALEVQKLEPARSLILPSEYLMAWTEWKAFPHAAYCFL
jgi:hypothetical protein